MEVGDWVLTQVTRFNWSSPKGFGPYKVKVAPSHCVKVCLSEDRLRTGYTKLTEPEVLNLTQRTEEQFKTDLKDLKTKRHKLRPGH